MSQHGLILIVDDEPAIAAMLQDQLVGHGYRAEVALHGGDAVMLASLQRPDAVILDLMLPEMSGEHIFHELRALDPSIAIVLLTGMGDETVGRALLSAGAFDFLRKPPDFTHLRTTIGLAVAAGRERSRPGTILPLSSDRRTPPSEAPGPETERVRSDFLRRPFR